MSIRYAPGPAFALVRPGLVVVVDSTVGLRTVARLWDVLEDVGPDDGMAVVLDAVTTVLDPTWRALPAFSVVALTGLGSDTSVAAHVASRGELAVHLRSAAGETTVAGRSVTTWVENQLDDVHSVTLGPGGDDAEDRVLTILDGIVQVSALEWDVAAAPSVVAVEAPEDLEAESPKTEPEQEPPRAESPEPVAVGATAVEPTQDVEPETGPARDEARQAGTDLDSEARPADGPETGPDDDGALPVAAFSSDEPASSEEHAPDDDPELEPEPEPEPAASAGNALPEAELRELEFGRTLADLPEDWRDDESGADEVAGATPSVEPSDDAVAESSDVPVARRVLRDEDPSAPVDADGSEQAGAGGPDSVDPDLLDAPGPADLEDDGSDEDDEDLDDSTILSSAGSAIPVPAPARAVPVPSAVAPPPPAAHAPVAGQGAGPVGLPPVPPPPPPPPAPGTGYGIIVPLPTPQPAPQPQPQVEAGPGLVSPPPAEEPAPQVSAPSGPVPKAPEILARSCFFGHANPPVRMTCSQCGGGLSPNAQLVERPSLGRVRFSHGEVVELVQPVVVGRFPMPQSQQPPAPRLVTVLSPSQDVSRSHLEVRLEGWHVLLVDLDTVNGTTLLRTGQAPRRLHPHEPTLIAEGDVVDLGDGVLLTFEGIA